MARNGPIVIIKNFLNHSDIERESIWLFYRDKAL
ncbi:MAG: hypothetical protein ACI9YE_001168 [Psychroserpens sp.]|jgi:hypothetical protein